MTPMDEILQLVQQMPKETGYPFHLANRSALVNYERIAKETASLAGSGRLLDWGCGYGQMTFLLRQMGTEVVPYDISIPSNISGISPLSKIDVIIGPAGSSLPFSDDGFDAVLSCGVLEHVPEPEESLAEIARIIKPGGHFLIYMLPNRYSWAEWISRIRGISAHPVLYTPGPTKRMLERRGFRVIKMRKYNFLPKNLTGLPGIFRKIYDSYPGFVCGVDNLLSRIPIINQICGVLEIQAVKL